MHWLDEQYHKERREEEVRALQREAEIQALLAQKQPKASAKDKNVRRAVGGKLIQIGERLQDAQSAPRASTSEI